jgi:hypothetical protein
MYKIIRFYFKSGKRTIRSGVTLAEAQAHCKSIEASFQTCTTSVGRARTKRTGPWFDGYDQC